MTYRYLETARFLPQFFERRKDYDPNAETINEATTPDERDCERDPYNEATSVLTPTIPDITSDIRQWSLT